jgi:beta-N-acetylhexosaminidase
VRYFPSQWGLARTGSTKHIYECAKAVGTQLAAVGFNVIHSPVLDVILDPACTYIGTRAFGQGAEFVGEMGSAFLRGFRDAGVMCCGKHYPGRGATDIDDHHDLGEIPRTDEEMWNVELAPYRRLMAEGLPMIMIGHTIYPAWDKVHPASCSRTITTDVTRGRMGFKGIVTTDSMIMLAIAKKYGSIPAGCLMAAKAGANLILMKETGPIRDEAYRLVLEAASSGEIPEKELDERIATTLRWKVDYGLYAGRAKVDARKAPKIIRSKAMERAETHAAQKAVHVVRDEPGLLPLSRQIRTLVVEQIAGPHLNANYLWAHPGCFWEALLGKSDQVALLEIEMDPKADDRAKVLEYMKFYDVIIMTHYSGRSTRSTVNLIKEVLGAGKKVIVVTNSPLPYDTPTDWPTVVCTYGVMPPVLQAAAGLIYGDLKPARPKVKQAWDR